MDDTSVSALPVAGGMARRRFGGWLAAALWA